MTKTDGELLLGHMESLAGGRARFFGTRVPGINVVHFAAGSLARTVAFTTGLSNVPPPSQAPHEHIELFIRIDALDDAWAHAAGEVAARLAGRCPFRPGDLINFREPISDDSLMNAFVVAAPEDLNTAVQLARFRVTFRELIPLYEEEREWGLEVGGEQLLKHYAQGHGWNPRDVNRRNLAARV